MTRTTLTRLMKDLVLLVFVAAGPAGCGRDTPISPGVAVEPSTPRAQAVPAHYDLTVTAGEPCGELEGQMRQIADTTLPEPVKSRTYTAMVTTLPDLLGVDVGGPNLSSFGFGLIRSDNRLQFMIDGPAFFEKLPGFAYLEIFGAGEAAVENLEAPQITIPFSGAFEYCVLMSEMGRSSNCFMTPPSQRTRYSVCQSFSHRLTLTRR